jgi:IPT/TIG domain
MELRARTRLHARRAAMMATLGVLVVPATAGAATKHHAPTIRSISPRTVTVGKTLVVRGKNFRRGTRRTTVVFQRSHDRAVFVKARISTTKKLYVVIPATLTSHLKLFHGQRAPTRFHLRILTNALGKRYTANRLSPVIRPKPVKSAATGDCDHDGVVNSTDADDDNDLLPDTVEAKYGLNPCNADTDGDGVSDGFEFQSALDLNDDDYQHPNGTIPYPGKRPYPNPLDPTDAHTDFDGDSLGMAVEYKLWRYTIAHGAAASLAHLTYSDGLKYSIYKRDPAHNDRRVPALKAAGYDKAAQFLNWAAAAGYGKVVLPDENTPRWLTDFNRDGTPDATSFDFHGNGFGSGPDGYLSDDERDEDADGLSNYFENGGSLSSPEWWKTWYPIETPFHITYQGTAVDDPDTDGDGIRDGADDQDHDGYPNIVEALRSRITGVWTGLTDVKQTDLDALALPWWGRVQPFNPCLPNPNSATCPWYQEGTTPWAPFDGPPYSPKGKDLNYVIND